METLRNTPLSEVVIKRQEALLEEKDITMKKAQASEARALSQLEAERLEKEQLLKKLKDAGIE